MHFPSWSFTRLSRSARLAGLSVLLAAAAPLAAAPAAAAAPASAPLPANVTVFATGLNNPRGLAFGPSITVAVFRCVAALALSVMRGTVGLVTCCHLLPGRIWSS
jgi:hypothetical protein